MQTNICLCTGACKLPPYRCGAMSTLFYDPDLMTRSITIPPPPLLPRCSKPYAKKKADQ